mgnify:CR=1 FL=1
MAIAGGNIVLDSTEGMDKVTQTEKVTSPYFSDGTTILTQGGIISTSLSDTNEKYFFGISKTGSATTEEFNVTFGSTNGFGANVEANTKSETEVIYKQYANLLLAPTEVTGGFKIAIGGSDPAVKKKIGADFTRIVDKGIQDINRTVAPDKRQAAIQDLIGKTKEKIKTREAGGLIIDDIQNLSNL